MQSQAKCGARHVRLCSVLALAVPAVLRIDCAKAEQPLQRSCCFTWNSEPEWSLGWAGTEGLPAEAEGC